MSQIYLAGHSVLPMRLFLHIARLAFQQQLTYRTATLAGLATNFFFALLRMAVLTALYQGRTEVNGMTLHDAVTYVAVSQAMIAFLSIFGSFDLIQSVSTGSIGVDLLKPMPLFFLWMARDLGRSLVNLIGRGLLLVAAFSLFYPMKIPSGLEGWLAFLAAASLGWLVSYAWRFLINLTAFWTPDARGIGRGAYTLSQVFSGFIMPLRLFPDWFSDLCMLTPFPALFHTTLDVYLGLTSGPDLWAALLNQVTWFLVLTILCHIMLTAGVRRLVIQGG